MPVWHEATARWVKEGRLVVVGITQEQHPERCRLLAQWKGFEWPIVHDPINVMESSAVPLFVAIDEFGIVRNTRPRLEQFEQEFLDRTWKDDAPVAPPVWQTPRVQGGKRVPDFDRLEAAARNTDEPRAWRDLGDELALWGGPRRIEAAVTAYRHAIEIRPTDGPAHFRLGVCYRQREESEGRKPGDFQRAIDAWTRALDLDPNQYIWRRRIQQYGPRLEKPYAFYDWVEQAERDIRGRGETPVRLPVRPSGSEIAQPSRTLEAVVQAEKSPDPMGRITRDAQHLVRIEVTVVPSNPRPGQTVRVHVVLRPDRAQRSHWNNEAEPLRLWVEGSARVVGGERLLKAASGAQPVSHETRRLEFELQLPNDAQLPLQLSAFALYHVCEDDGGQCRYLRQDLTIQFGVRP